MLENINEKDLYVGYIKNEEPTLTVLKKENNGYTLLFLNNKLISESEINIISKLNDFLNKHSIKGLDNYFIEDIELKMEEYNFKLSCVFELKSKIDKLIKELSNILPDDLIDKEDILEIAKANLYSRNYYALALKDKVYIVTLDKIIVRSNGEVYAPYIESHIKNLTPKHSNR